MLQPKSIAILFILQILYLPIRAQFTDNFSDNNFTTNPVWIGDTSKFDIKDQQLRLNDATFKSPATLWTASNACFNATWSFYVKMEFNPTSSNYAKVYLMSNSNIDTALQGYFLRIGYTNKNLALYRQDGKSTKLVSESRKNLFNSDTVKCNIRVSRNNKGDWSIEADTLESNNFSTYIVANDSTFQQSEFFGVGCIYTKTRSKNFVFDNFEVAGEKYPDWNTNPTFPSKPILSKDSSNIFDVVFNEIMVDPSPAISLPESEYIELYNKSNHAILISGWKLEIGTTQYQFPIITIPANNYLIITSKTDTSKLRVFGKTLGLFTSTTSLSNAGQSLKLRNSNNSLIDWVEYDDTWYTDDYKKNGGWSLEKIDIENPCADKTNWKASTSKFGGTPGAKNSIADTNADISAPIVTDMRMESDSVFTIIFNETVDSLLAMNQQNFEIAPNIGNPTKIVSVSNNYTSFQVHLKTTLQLGITYTLYISNNVCDCVGNKMDESIQLKFGLPENLKYNDLVINEVLFNTSSVNAEFVEIYNRTNKFFDAKKIFIGVAKNETEINWNRLTETGFLIQPHDYIVVSKYTEKIISKYNPFNPSKFYTLTNIPALDDKLGTILLANDTLETIDNFQYAEKMQLADLINKDDVSLERMNPNQPTHFPGNWHSASHFSGYATPGRKNSQYLSDDSIHTSHISMDNDVFSPDNDGYNDVLKINYHCDAAGYRAQAIIFDAKGQIARTLFSNLSIDVDGVFTWDGTNNNGKMCKTDPYIVFVKIVNDNGIVRNYRLPCVVSIKK